MSDCELLKVLEVLGRGECDVVWEKGGEGIGFQDDDGLARGCDAQLFAFERRRLLRSLF